MGENVRSALASKVALLDRMKKVSAFVEVVLTVGEQVSEVICHNSVLSAELKFRS